MNKKQAIQQIHFPQENAMLQEARKRLVFEEFYQFILGVRTNEAATANAEKYLRDYRTASSMGIGRKTSLSPNQCTEKCISDICSDMVGAHRMNRLVQGDVGSGKTIVAFLALYQVALCHYQAAMMAQPKCLATQHYEALNKMIEHINCQFKPFF